MTKERLAQIEDELETRKGLTSGLSHFVYLPLALEMLQEIQRLRKERS